MAPSFPVLPFLLATAAATTSLARRPCLSAPSSSSSSSSARPASRSSIASSHSHGRQFLLRLHRSGLPSSRLALRASAGTSPTLFNDIAGFYDSLSGIWEREYGEHMHHGYYGPASSPTISVQEAQIALMEETAKLGGIAELAKKIQEEEGRPIRILDVGCGIGGASRWLAKTFDADVTGISLSPKQVARAKELADKAGLSEKNTYEVKNALESGFPDGQFDVVWSLEMAEHIPDRPRFLSEINRMLNKKHGRLAMVTWCKKDGVLDLDEDLALSYISKWYNLPRWVSAETWVSLAPAAGFKETTYEDWSKNIRPMQFWGDILVTSLQPKNLLGLLAIGDSGVKAGAAAGLMGYGFYKNFIVFAATRMDVTQS